MDLEVDIREAFEMLLHEAFRVVLSDLLPSHLFLFLFFFCRRRIYGKEIYKYCSVFEREKRNRDGRIELDGK